MISRFPPDRADIDERRATADENRNRCASPIIGRPNVGKSTLINRLLGFERSVVDAMPGTTRDSLDTPFDLLGEPCVLIDTAGIRRKARIDDRIERFSVSRSLKAVDRGDLIIHIIDGPEGVTDQDAQILSYAVQRGKALMLAVNKWDLVSKDGGDVEKYRDEVNYRSGVSGICAGHVHLGGDRLRRAQDARDRGASCASLTGAKFRPRRSTKRCKKSSELTARRSRAASR